MVRPDIGRTGWLGVKHRLTQCMVGCVGVSVIPRTLTLTVTYLAATFSNRMAVWRAEYSPQCENRAAGRPMPLLPVVYSRSIDTYSHVFHVPWVAARTLPWQPSPRPHHHHHHHHQHHLSRGDDSDKAVCCQQPGFSWNQPFQFHWAWLTGGFLVAAIVMQKYEPVMLLFLLLSLSGFMLVLLAWYWRGVRWN